MPIGLANAPVSWGIMEVEGWTAPPIPCTTFLDELKAAGYDATELGPYGYFPTDAAVLRAELEGRSLALASAFTPLRLKQPGLDLAPAREVAKLLQACGARHLVLADAMWPEREAVSGRVEESSVRLTDRDWQTVAANLRRASELAAAFGLRPVFHHHAGTYIETPEECARLLASTGVALCLDTGHYVYGGGDPVQAVQSFGRRIEYLHFKDVDPARLDHARRLKLDFVGAVRAGIFCPLGSGSVRFPDLLRALDRIDYDGWAVVEQDVDASDPNAPPPRIAARASREYLRSELGI